MIKDVRKTGWKISYFIKIDIIQEEEKINNLSKFLHPKFFVI
jgi:hypothetical protein